MGTVEQLEREIAELATRTDVATHRLLTCIRQFFESNAWAAQGAVSCAHWLSWRIGLDLVTARERVRVARALGNLPPLDAAMATGKLSYSKVRAISQRADSEGRDVLCPDEADQLFRALDRAREVEHEATRDDDGGAHASAESSKRAGHHDGCPAEPHLPSRADAVVALAETYLAGHAVRGTGGDRFQVTIHVDQDPLAPEGVFAATLEDGTAISAETLRRVACDG